MTYVKNIFDICWWVYLFFWRFSSIRI